MSLFDEIRCDYPLPDGWQPGTRVFQSQDTPAQYLVRYVLQADGSLIQEDTGETVPLHGALTFYTGNVCGTGPEGYITDDDQDPWWAEYTALYDHGTLLKLEGSKQPDTTLRGPHLRREEWHRRVREAMEAKHG